MRIGELSDRTGVSIRSLRYYEEQGLLTSVRSSRGQRHYTEAEVDRVVYLQRLYVAGLSSRTIRALLPCLESPSEDNTEASYVRLQEERDRLTAHLAEVSLMRDALDGLLTANPRAAAIPWRRALPPRASPPPRASEPAERSSVTFSRLLRPDRHRFPPRNPGQQSWPCQLQCRIPDLVRRRWTVRAVAGMPLKTLQTAGLSGRRVGVASPRGVTGRGSRHFI